MNRSGCSPSLITKHSFAIRILWAIDLPAARFLRPGCNCLHWKVWAGREHPAWSAVGREWACLENLWDDRKQEAVATSPDCGCAWRSNLPSRAHLKHEPPPTLLHGRRAPGSMKKGALTCVSCSRVLSRHFPPPSRPVLTGNWAVSLLPELRKQYPAGQRPSSPVSAHVQQSWEGAQADAALQELHCTLLRPLRSLVHRLWPYQVSSTDRLKKTFYKSRRVSFIMQHNGLKEWKTLAVK